MSVYGADANWKTLKQKVMLGDKQIGKIYAGDTLVYPEKEKKVETGTWVNLTHISMDVSILSVLYGLKRLSNSVGTYHRRDGVSISGTEDYHTVRDFYALHGPRPNSAINRIDVSGIRGIQCNELNIKAHIDIIIDGHYDVIEETNNYSADDSDGIFITNGVNPWLYNTDSKYFFTNTNYNIYTLNKMKSLIDAPWSVISLVQVPNSRLEYVIEHGIEDIPVYYYKNSTDKLHVLDMWDTNFQIDNDIHNKAETVLSTLDFKLADNVLSSNDGVLTYIDPNSDISACIHISYDAEETLSFPFDDGLINIENRKYTSSGLVPYTSGNVDVIPCIPHYSEYGNIPPITYKCSFSGTGTFSDICSGAHTDDEWHRRNNIYHIDSEKLSALESWFRDFASVKLFVKESNISNYIARYLSQFNNALNKGYPYDIEANTLMDNYIVSNSDRPNFSREDNPMLYDAIDGSVSGGRQIYGADQPYSDFLGWAINNIYETRGYFGTNCAMLAMHKKDITIDNGIFTMEPVGFTELYNSHFRNKIILPTSDKWTILKGCILDKFGIDVPYKRDSTCKYKVTKIRKRL